MNTFDYASSKNKEDMKSPEMIALMVFVGIYVFVRVVETYIIPRVPEFLTREVGALFRWGPVLVPIIFGITYYSKKLNPVYDTILKERMTTFMKK